MRNGGNGSVQSGLFCARNVPAMAKIAANATASMTHALRHSSRVFRIVTMSALKALSIAALIYFCSALSANSSKPEFKVIAFFTAKEDQAHISFVHEAERWFPEIAAKYNFSFDTTSNWKNLNSDFLSNYQVVVF